MTNGSPPSSSEVYSVKDISTLLEVTEAQVLELARIGLPERALPHKNARFSFRDLLLLKTTKKLRESRISGKRVQQALQKLRAQLPAEMPLTGVTLEAIGPKIVARAGNTRWYPDSGQALLALEQDPGASADAYFAKGCELEEHDVAAAQRAYERAIAVEPTHADAHVNLGRLYQLHKNPKQAEKHYRHALKSRPHDATALFNLATALEDQGRDIEAINAYAEAIAADDACLDAYFNLAKLYERRGEQMAAIRHFKDYRRLTHRS